MSHPCPKEGCPKVVPGEMFACRDHWFQISKRVRANIWASYRSCDVDAHAAATAEAIEELNS